MRRFLTLLGLLILGTIPAHAQNCFPTATCLITPPVVMNFGNPPGAPTLKADSACNSILQLNATSAGGNVTTSTTAPFPSVTNNNDGCNLFVCNVGTANSIIVKHNATCTTPGTACFLTTTGADLTIAPNQCFGVSSTGVRGGSWLQVSPVQTNS